MFTKHFLGNLLSTVGIINEMDATLEASLLEVAHAATTSKDLRLDNHASLDSRGNLLGLSSRESHVTKRNWHLEFVKQSAGLVLVELQSSQGKGWVGN